MTGLRAAEEGDFAAIARIYGEHVLHGFGSFEEVPPDPAELTRRWREVRARGLPYFVLEAAEGVVGFAYASPYRSRSAYRFTVEDSVYVASGATRRGYGRALLSALIDRCADLDYRQMVAVIGDRGNTASIGLHTAVGFIQAGVLTGVGFKHGRWIDSVLMQRRIGLGTNAPPGGKKGP